MSENRLPDYLDHIQQAATDARSFVEGMARDDFLADKCTQQAVIMSLIVIGEAATKVMDGYAEFTQAHADVPWRSMRNMRNRMAHGYFDINLDVVWETVQQWLPELLKQLPAVRLDANDPAVKAYPHEEAMQVVQERIDHCSFHVATRDGSISMCQHNARRDDYIIPANLVRGRDLQPKRPLSRANPKSSVAPAQPTESEPSDGPAPAK